MVQWLRVEARDREIQVRFPVPAAISDLVVVCHSSWQYGNKNTGGPLWECTPHMQSKDPPLPFGQEKPILEGTGIGRGFSIMAYDVL